MCRGVFDKIWSDDEAATELSEKFPHVTPADSRIVCDDCYRQMGFADDLPTILDYREAAEWMATYIMGHLPDHNTMTPDEIADYEQRLQEIVYSVSDRIGKP